MRSEQEYDEVRQERDATHRELQQLRYYMSVRMVVFSDHGVGPISLLEEYERAVEDGFFTERERR